MPYALLADALVVAHFAYMAFIVGGLLAILVGGFRGWAWVQNLWLRLAHLAAIVVVALEACFGILCPLTRWEHDLRVLAGQQGEEGTFVGRLVRRLLFYDFPPWVFTAAYVAFALAVLATLYFVPPKTNRGARGDGPRSKV